MGQTDHKPKTASLPARLGAAAAALLCLGLLAASPASAAPFEQVGCFAGSLPGLTDSCKPVANEEFGEEVQLGGLGGMAVNYTGAGGVPAGTVYAAIVEGSGPNHVRIAMFTPALDGGLEFRQSWQVTIEEGPYERCGPDGEPTHPTCAPRVESSEGWVDVDVDQSTGNVYVFNGQIVAPGPTLLTAYSADGAEVIARFGELAASGKTTAETPEKLHAIQQPGGIAVNEAGEVYVSDLNPYAAGFYHRLMVFKPQSPGDYEDYVYAGEVAAGFFQEGEAPAKPVTDAAGNVYVAGDEYVEMYEPEAPGAYPAGPAAVACRFEFAKGGITAITVDPEGGQVFFFGFKNPKRVFQLSPCNEGTGKFEEAGKEGIVGEFTVTPQRGDLWGLAFDPVRQLPGRAPGVLYGGAPGPVPVGTGGKGEPGQSSLGYLFAAVEENPPEVGAESVSHVTTTSALLHAEVNPKGRPTGYAFQYLTEAAYEANEPSDRFAGAKEAPLGGGSAGEGTEPVAVSAALSGLSPDTAYRFRVSATNHCSALEEEEVCEDVGADQSFRTFPVEAPGLPDDRAYELVSPAQKSGGQVLPADPRIDSCEGLEECKPGTTYTHFPMQSAPGGDAVVYEGTPFSASGGAAIENQYIARRTASGWQSVNLTPSLLQSKESKGFKAFDPSLSQGLLEQSNPPLSPAAPPDYRNLYSQPTADPFALAPMLAAAPPNRAAGEFKLSYAGAAADLSRVFFRANDALTEATPFAPAAVDGGAGKDNLYEWERASGELRLVNVAPGNAASEPGASFGAASAHAISTDGSRAFWSDEAGQLYVREDAEATREIPDTGKFLAAATDGSKVLLTNGHIYDLEEETTTDLTEGKGGFQGLVGQSEDLSRLYFVDTAVLDEAPNARGDEAEAGQNNLYAWSEGGTRFVATLAAIDNGSGSDAFAKSWSSLPNVRTAQASPNGRFAAFLSQAPLTGYDNTGPCAETGSGEILMVPCPEAFLYDSATEELTCVSCNPSAAAPLGLTGLRLLLGGDQSHYLTDKGRLYFDSRDSLVPADTNESVEDVYQYEPEGIGTCKREGGCTALISAGTGVADSNFLAMDEDGKNVFFTTRDQLLIKDKDELIDLYVAREDGGIAAETETQKGECQGETCQPAAFVPNDPTPGSSSFQGSGNVKQGNAKPRCPKGRRQVQRKGKPRCVKRKRARAANRNRGGGK